MIIRNILLSVVLQKHIADDIDTEKDVKIEFAYGTSIMMLSYKYHPYDDKKIVCESKIALQELFNLILQRIVSMGYGIDFRYRNIDNKLDALTYLVSPKPAKESKEFSGTYGIIDCLTYVLEPCLDIDSKVEIIDGSNVYEHYAKIAIREGLENFEYGYNPGNSSKGVIEKIVKHEDFDSKYDMAGKNSYIAIVKLENGKQILIDIKGLERLR